MEEKKKHKVMIGIEVVLLCMLVAILGTNAASSNPPSNGVSYGGNNQTTVEGALNDLYNKANYGNASEGQIMSGKTALVGGKKITGTIVDRTNDTGTLGLAWSTGNYEMIGNQLRIGVNKGYYGTNNYSNWGISGIVFNDYQSRLGITADKIVKGQSIAGITGTGETSCPSCPDCPTCPTPESQGYYKIKKFEKIKAGVASYQTFDGKWKHLADHTEYNCKNGVCDSTNGKTRFYVNLNSDLGISPTEIVDYTLTLSCNVAEGIRFNRGYASNSTTVQYWYPEKLAISSSGGRMNWWTGSSTTNTQWIEAEVSTIDSAIGMVFRVVRGASGNGTANSTFETKCTEFYLSGSITYR